MKLNYFFVSLLILLSILGVDSAQGQITFEKTYGGSKNDFGHSVQQTSDGGYILFGQTESFGKGWYDMYLVKTDYLGELEWEKTFGTEIYDLGTSVQQTTDGGYILCGAYSGLGNDSLALIRTDIQGNAIWNKRYRGSLIRDVGRFVQQTMDGGFVAIGYNGDGFIEDVFLLKTDANGNELWKKTYGGMGRDEGICIRQTEDGGYVIIGQTNSKGHGGDDMYLLRTNSFGDTLWTKTFGTEKYETGYSVAVTNDGGFILLGNDSELDGDMYLVKTDADGEEEWSRYYGGARREGGYSVQQTTDGGYILAGSKEDEITYHLAMYVIKINNAGDVQWEKTYSKGVIDDARSVQQTSDGGFILLGTTTSFIDSNYRTDMYLVKIDSMGILAGIGNTVTDYELQICPNPFNQYTIFKFNGPVDDEYTLILFDAQGKELVKKTGIVHDEILLERKDLLPGIYFFKIISGDRVIGKGKIIAM